MAKVTQQLTRPASIVLLLLGLLMVGAGCTLTPRAMVSNPADSAQDLLSGVSVFGEVVSANEVPDAEVLAIDDDMRAFVTEYVGRSGNSVARFRRLLRNLEAQGYFTSTYDAGKTHSALDTFHGRSGNCLSFTNMFVALGREAKLNTTYQIVDVPPSWDADNGYLIRFTHINVLVKGVSFARMNTSEYTVDFNDVVPDPSYHRREVSDAYALGLFYGNLSVSELRNGDLRRSFAYLKKAIELAPRNEDLWINLGAFFASQEAHEEAVEAYHVALGLKRNSKASMSGLARSLYVLGQDELAMEYAEKVRRYRQKNPFYHLALAQIEYQNSNYDLAIKSADKAIDLKKRNPRFYLLKGLAEQQLGDDEAARKSFDQVKRYGKSDENKRRMREDLISLNPTQPVIVREFVDEVESASVQRNIECKRTVDRSDPGWTRVEANEHSSRNCKGL